MSSQIAVTRIEWLIWILVYGGLLTFVVSLFLPPQDDELALWMTACGLAVAAAGFACVYIRSKMKVPK
jgi:hypothetical protein